MPTDACCTRKKRTRAAWFALVPGTLLAVLAPKCPFCLAAYLSLIGLGMGTAGVLQPMLRPFGIAILSIAALTLAVRYGRRFTPSE